MGLGEEQLESMARSWGTESSTAGGKRCFWVFFGFRPPERKKERKASRKEGRKKQSGREAGRNNQEVRQEGRNGGGALTLTFNPSLNPKR